MTDLLEIQAAIKSRRQVVRDTSGKFVRQSEAIRVRLAAERMKARLERDVKASEHARGVVYEHGHYHALPKTDKPVLALVPAPVPTLFDRRAA